MNYDKKIWYMKMSPIYHTQLYKRSEVLFPLEISASTKEAEALLQEELFLTIFTPSSN